MLADFVTSNRDAIIVGAQARGASRPAPEANSAEPTSGIPVFLDQLAEALRQASSTDVVDHEQLGESAGRHGLELFRRGLSIGQVVHDYGNVCQAITELAVQRKEPISADEFQMLNLCLDDAIAEAVTTYSREREQVSAAQGLERLGVLAHELRNLLNTAMLSFENIKSGRVAAGGSTGVVHSRSLLGLRDLIDRSLVEVRLDAGIQRLERVSVSELIEEIEIGATIQAHARGLQLKVASADGAVTLEGDRQILAATVSNLLQNAIKFTRAHGTVSLTTRVTADRVLFEVQDECGGLPPGKIEDLFRPFEQAGADRSGVGLGLSICRKAAKAHGGEIRVRDLPGSGCVFTLDLPRQRTPPSQAVGGAGPGSSP